VRADRSNFGRVVGAQMPRTPFTCLSPVDILEEPLDTVLSRELGRRHGFTRVYSMPGKYKALYEYLEHRYANTVVLTFAQIEDLLGFTLPDAARVDHAWWANNGPNDIPPPHSRSWTLASRTATPNLPAQTVVFERAQQ
jgi:hypothetical protein